MGELLGANRPVSSAHAAVLRELILPPAAHNVIDGGHEACVPVLTVVVAREDVGEEGPKSAEEIAVALCEGRQDNSKGGV